MSGPLGNGKVEKAKFSKSHRTPFVDLDSLCPAGPYRDRVISEVVVVDAKYVAQLRDRFGYRFSDSLAAAVEKAVRE